MAVAALFQYIIFNEKVNVFFDFFKNEYNLFL